MTGTGLVAVDAGTASTCSTSDPREYADPPTSAPSFRRLPGRVAAERGRRDVDRMGSSTPSDGCCRGPFGRDPWCCSWTTCTGPTCPSVELLRFVAHQPRSGALLLVGAYRPGSRAPDVAAALADLPTGRAVAVSPGWPPDEVADLMVVLTGTKRRSPAGPQLVHRAQRRPPFLRARTLPPVRARCWPGDARAGVPAAVRDVLGRRLARLPDDCATLLDVGRGGRCRRLLLDVLRRCPGRSETAAAVAAGRRARTAGDPGRRPGPVRFRVPVRARPVPRDDLCGLPAGAAVGAASSGRRGVAASVHGVAACVPGRTGPALRGRGRASRPIRQLAWANAAADADVARFAFAEAAGHLTRARTAVTAPAAGCRRRPIHLLTARRTCGCGPAMRGGAGPA